MGCYETPFFLVLIHTFWGVDDLIPHLQGWMRLHHPIDFYIGEKAPKYIENASLLICSPPCPLLQDEFPAPDEFPVSDEYPPVLKWRRKPSVVSVSSSLPDLLGNSTSSLGAVDTPFQTDQPLEGEEVSHCCNIVGGWGRQCCSFIPKRRGSLLFEIHMYWILSPTSGLVMHWCQQMDFLPKQKKHLSYYTGHRSYINTTQRITS